MSERDTYTFNVVAPCSCTITDAVIQRQSWRFSLMEIVRLEFTGRSGKKVWWDRRNTRNPMKRPFTMMKGEKVVFVVIVANGTHMVMAEPQSFFNNICPRRA